MITFSSEISNVKVVVDDEGADAVQLWRPDVHAEQNWRRRVHRRDPATSGKYESFAGAFERHRTSSQRKKFWRRRFEWRHVISSVTLGIVFARFRLFDDQRQRRKCRKENVVVVDDGDHVWTTV